ncbi:MAG: YitT family protein [Ruminococcaceae bacterium]|nr:YitT family protein [Oscillospiraceae bacterium]
MKKTFFSYMIIVLGSALYALATVLFIFPRGLLLGGTSGISVILNAYLPVSPGSILVAINFLLLIMAFFVLGREMAIKTFVGSVLTTIFVGVFEVIFAGGAVLIPNVYLSSVTGAALIAVASGMMFYVKSSSGGTDIIALIVKKYSQINIGKALLITDVLIVIIGGALSGYIILVSSFIGLLIKTFGIDFVIDIIERKND